MSGYSINYPHGIMFHHFHNEMHPAGQGSISAQEFEQLLLYIGLNNIVSASDWMTSYRDKSDLTNKVCITFDDSLKCQMDVAKPVLDKYGIKAFFFVYTSVVKGGLEYLEVFRYFRSKYFSGFDDFYNSFIKSLETSAYAHEVRQALQAFKPDEYLKEFAFYSKNDRIFRYLRDHVLKPQKYNEVMLGMIAEKNIEIDQIKDLLWMNQQDLKNLHAEGHVLGLHSDTHPMTMGLISTAEQLKEYTENKQYLEQLLGEKVECMSHPCNSYNQETLSVLNNLGVSLGFRANMQRGFDSTLELPRQDHVNVLKMMKEGS